MRTSSWLRYTIGLYLGIGFFASYSLAQDPTETEADDADTMIADYAGSSSCRPCHSNFYKLWSTSHHGLAMQPYSKGLGRNEFKPQAEPIKVGKYKYRMDLEKGAVIETADAGTKQLPVAHVMGGKNVFYLLTPMEGGKLQVMPIAYDHNRKEWYDTTESMVRHFSELPDEPVHWTDPLLTFNRSCYNCHVSQLSKNYDLETDTYQTTWSEPGINCETCHGPAQAHVKSMMTAHSDPNRKLGLISTRHFTAEQTDGMCGPCHAKAAPITSSFMPGEKFFDHYQLTTYEDRDWYPDGRDLGENFTYTHWLTSPCTTDKTFDCLHCHTSSGRDRHAANPNQSCMPCHQEIVDNSADHSRHKVGSEGDSCIACHMPETEFARMRRHDHTFLPPTPAATIKFGSPNACNICHNEKSAEWADEYVRQWYSDDYQKPLIHRGELVEAARKQDFSRLPEMLAYIKDDKSNAVFITSLIRLLAGCTDESKWPAIIDALEHESPLVRSAAAMELSRYNDPKAVDLLQAATDDQYRIVRVQAAQSLTFFPTEPTPDQLKATEELLAWFKGQPDQPSSHYNLGNYYFNRNELEKAREAFQTSLRLDPNNLLSLVNISMVYVRLNQPDEARKALERALEIAPDSAEANFNYGLLMAELQQFDKAEAALRKALKADEDFAAAAFNLAILVAQKDLDEAVKLTKQAHRAAPNNPRYTYTYAYYLYQSGDLKETVRVLDKGIAQTPEYLDMRMLKAQAYEDQQEFGKATRVYLDALKIEGLDDRSKMYIQQRIQAIENR